MSMKQGSKLWWKLASFIMGSASKECNIPALKTDVGEWIMDAPGKANLIATTLAAKFALNEKENNCFSSLTCKGIAQADVPMPTTDMAFHELNSLREDSGTGPDDLPARILNIVPSGLQHLWRCLS